MERSRFMEGQIIGILCERELRLKTAYVCRKHGISEATFHKYKAWSGGVGVSDAWREAGGSGSTVRNSWCGPTRGVCSVAGRLVRCLMWRWRQTRRNPLCDL